jgi:hypothetical protein
MGDGLGRVAGLFFGSDFRFPLSPRRSEDIADAAFVQTGRFSQLHHHGQARLVRDLLSTVHAQHLPGNPAGGIGGKEEDGVGNVFRLAETLQGDGLD